ncbi:MAG: thiol:disulfide interchange protein DsbA/DsbL [Gammaproteobacteria bacterium]|nr:thiol:disulfide interchange protein DsbA/DsbL [Gammaproteobacteria bacterium]
MKRLQLMINTCAVIACAFVLAACDQPDAPPAAAAPAATAATADADAAPADTAAAATDAAGAAVAAVEETAGEAAAESAADADPAADAGEIELKAAPAAAVAAPVDWQFSEGSHFRRMTASQGTSSNPDKIEVAEIFWYGCNHCYNFDPMIEDWKASQPSDVAFVRIPVIWSPTHQEHARLMYTAEALGVLDQAHEAIFASFHQQGNTLAKEADIVKLFASLGVDEAAFREAYNSFGVTSAVKRAENLTRRYGIRSVPTIVVNGKYVTEGDGIKSYGDLLDVTNELVERERRDL